MWRILRWLWEKLYGAPPESEPQPDSGQELLDFSESIEASVEPASARRSPEAGTAIIEAQNLAGDAIALDTVSAPPAPRGTYHIDGIAATHVVVPHGSEERAHQEFTLTNRATLQSLGVPQHILDKDFDRVRFWWSCESDEQ